MKKIAYFITFACFILLVGCTSNATPKSTVRNYLKDIKHGKSMEALKLLYFDEQQTEEDLEELRELAQKIDDNISQQNGIVKYEILSEEKNEDKTQSTIIAKVLYGNGEEENMNFHLIKVDKKWLISPMVK